MCKKLLTVLFLNFIFNGLSAQILESSSGADIGSLTNSLSILRVIGQQSYMDLVSQTNKSSHIDFKNDEGFWHLSGPRAYEANSPFAIYWNDGTYHRLLSLNTKGYLGIGVDNPQVPLHSVGTFNMIQLRLERKGSSEGFCDLGGSDGDFRVWSGGYTKNHKFIVNGSTGYVGIGTLTPNYQLEVAGHLMAKSTNYIHIGVERPDSDGKITMGVSSGGQEGFLSSKGELKFLTDASIVPRMYIDKIGNVGIGISNLNDRLEVNGTIRAKEVKVEHTNWPDFVFSNNYQLKSLEEVDAFIVKNQHLPDVPSSDEINKEGIGLGEMDRKLLQKIEELTLYVIELKKENQQQALELMQIKIQLEESK